MNPVQIDTLCEKITKLIDADNWSDALTIARTLSGQISDVRACNAELIQKCKRCLFRLATHAERFHLLSAVEMATLAFEIDDGVSPTNRDYIAHFIGRWFEKERCFRNAAFWYDLSLGYARTEGDRHNLLLNLERLAWSYESSTLFDRAREYYTELWSLIGNTKISKELHSEVEMRLSIGMFELENGDVQLGESIIRSLLPMIRSRSKILLPVRIFVGFCGLARFYLRNSRAEDAVQLVRTIKRRTDRFETSADMKDICSGYIARGLARLGRPQEALTEMETAIGTGPWPSYLDRSVDHRELWLHLARLHVHLGNYAKAIDAYCAVARSIGGASAELHLATNTKQRMYWIEQQTLVVHELVSVWLSISDEDVRRVHEHQVANALLQLKANMFLALARNRLSRRNIMLHDHMQEPGEFFRANRGVAHAVREVIEKNRTDDVSRELERTLYERDLLESGMAVNDDSPAISIVFQYDFSRSQELREDTVAIDYSLIHYCPPQSGLEGSSRELRYVGIRLTKNHLRIIDIGSSGVVEALCEPWIRDAGTEPATSEASGEFLNLAGQIYDLILAPFEPLEKNIKLSPEGVLAALPFHAIRRKGRYLIEAFDVVLVHSLLQKENLNIRQMSPFTRINVDFHDGHALVVGDIDYTGTGLAPLDETRKEVDQLELLLRQHKWPNVYMYLGHKACAEVLEKCRYPRLLHIAAHGSYFDAHVVRDRRKRGSLGGLGWRRWEDLSEDPLSRLDHALFSAQIVLSPSTHGKLDYPQEDRLVTGLEISSLFLTLCDLCVLSSCSSGIGYSQSGAGVLGFQYALLATFVKSALVSLWSVPDAETAALMTEFYSRFLTRNDAQKAYNDTIRSLCTSKHNVRPVHPYYWAAFVLLDQSYG